MSNSLHRASFPLFQRTESYDNRQDLDNSMITDVWLQKPAPPRSYTSNVSFVLFLSFLVNYGLDANLLTLDEHLWPELSWYFYLEQFLLVFDLMRIWWNEWYAAYSYRIPLPLLRNLLTNPFPAWFWLHSLGVFPFASLLFLINSVFLAGQVRSDRIGSGRRAGKLSFKWNEGWWSANDRFFQIFFFPC